MALTLISFLLILLMLILVHEFGHYITAKIFKVGVEEFGIFMRPRIWGKKIGGTVYSINWLPIGGFVRLAGEEDPKAPNALAAKSIPVRLVVLGAGSIMNLLLPFILLSISLSLPHLVSAETGDVLVQSVRPDSPAEAAGIETGDYILSVNNEKLASAEDYSRIIGVSHGVEVSIDIKHLDGTTEVVRLIPRVNPPPEEGATGIAITTVQSERLSFWQAIAQSPGRYWNILVLFKDGLVATFRGSVPFEVAGPVGIAQATGEVARHGFGPLLQFAAIISINLGLVNILPLPALDGGRIVFVLIELVRGGKRVSPDTERLVHTIGFFMLMLLLLLATWGDITRILSGGTLTP
jgi:regulator of sigma E protease